MEEKKNDSFANFMAEQPLKGGQFNVEAIVYDDGRKLFIVKSPQGVPVRVFEDAAELASFFDRFLSEIGHE